ncbi:MAG: hypothetical protein COA96_13165 [SAR86 cluster bacterium]|uniref:DUF2799 domain-containing protein n=1 Tax=SAR86 cluster bacterium TaxID=2030880 RepID=A0A2A5AUD4_9GAMM|nr:MAG: hypothetical protein COA96_13165 [SAR86 cluster bacterium]
MKARRLIALILIGLIVSSCAVMSEEECIYSDWNAVGYEDGAEGRSSDRFGDYRRACADHSITPDFQAWQNGREQGLVEYCQPSRGFQVGQSGSTYSGVCNSNLEADFLDAYRLGIELYSLRSNLNAAMSQLNSNERTLQRIDEDINEIEVLIISDGTTALERVRLLAEMKDLSELSGELKLEAELLIEARTIAELELTDFEMSLVQAGF